MPLLPGRILASRSGSRWSVVVIEGGRDLNGKYYSAEAMRQYASVHEKVVVNAYPRIRVDGSVVFDHLSDPSMVGRSPLNQAGWIEGMRYDPASNEVVGELVLAETATGQEIQRHLAAIAAAGGLETLGLSIDSDAVVDRATGEILEVVELYSVDIVTHPAAGGRIGHRIAASSRVTRTTSRSIPMKTWFEKLKARCPRLVEGLTHADKDRVIASKIAERMRVKAMEGEAESILGFLMTDLAQIQAMDPNELIGKLENVIAFLKQQDGAAAPEGGEKGGGEGGGKAPEKVAASVTPPPVPPIPAREPAPILSLDAERERLAASRAEVDGELRTLRLERSERLLREACAGRKLTQDATDILVKRHKASVFATREEADAIANAEREYLDRHIESRTGDRVRVVRESTDNARDILAHMFAPGVIPVPKCGMDDIGYSKHRFNRKFFGFDTTDLSRGEAGFGRVKAAIDDTNYDQVYADALRRSLLADYNSDPKWMAWKQLVNIVSLQDFRTHRIIKTGFYGFLPDVGKQDPYPTLTTPTDSEETLTLAKKGGIERIAWEDQLNDDLSVEQTSIQRLSRAARETVFEAVFQQLRVASMLTLSDGKKLWDATRADANGGTSPLTPDATGKTNFIATVSAMAQLTGGSGQPKGVLPSFIIIPWAKLEAWAFIANELKAGNTGTEVAQVLGDILGWAIPKAIIDLKTGNATDWMVMAKPSDAEVLRMGFLGGRQEPELFISDDGRFSAMFSKDVVEIKIRHVYKVAPVDYVGIYGQDSAT